MQLILRKLMLYMRVPMNKGKYNANFLID